MSHSTNRIVRAYITLSALYFVMKIDSNILKFLIAYGACYVCIKIVVDDDDSGDNPPPPRD